MRLITKAVLAATAGAVTCLTAPATQSARAEASRSKPGEGVMCALGIYAFLEELGSRCVSNPDPTVQAGLHHAVTELDRFVLANGWSPATLARFKSEQAHVGQPKEQVCLAAWLPAYENLRRSGTEKLRSSVQRLVARPGPPAWGDCL